MPTKIEEAKPIRHSKRLDGKVVVIVNRLVPECKALGYYDWISRRKKFNFRFIDFSTYPALELTKEYWAVKEIIER